MSQGWWYLSIIIVFRKPKRKFKAALDSRARICLREKNKTGTEKKGDRKWGENRKGKDGGGKRKKRGKRRGGEGGRGSEGRRREERKGADKERLEGYRFN